MGFGDSVISPRALLRQPMIKSPILNSAPVQYLGLGFDLSGCRGLDFHQSLISGKWRFNRMSQNFLLKSVVLLASMVPWRAASCQSLASFSLPAATITSAAIVDAGKFIPPGPPRGVGAFGGPAPVVNDLPAFCR